MVGNDDRPCAEPLAEYYKCLSSSDRNVSQCINKENVLRKCSQADQDNNYCIDEIIRLLNCSRHPNPNGCSKEFILFRECNRPNGPEIIIKDDMYKIHPNHTSKYNVKTDAICSIVPPSRNTKSATNMINRMKEAMGLKNFTEDYKPHIKS